MKGIRRLAATDYGNVVQLEGEDPPQWRLRVGDWRVLFVYRRAEGMISVVRVLTACCDAEARAFRGTARDREDVAHAIAYPGFDLEL